MEVGALTRWAGRPAQVKQVAVRHTGSKETAWAELHVEGEPQRLWAPVWALPAKPSTKGSAWSNPTTADGGSTPQLTPTADDGEQVSSVSEPTLFPHGTIEAEEVDSEPASTRTVRQAAVVREEASPEREMPKGSFRDSLAKLMDDTGVDFEECGRLLHTTAEAVEDMLAGERPPFHPITCNGYRDLAARLGVSWVEMQRRAGEYILPKKKVSQGGKGGKKKHEDQLEFFAWEPAADGR